MSASAKPHAVEIDLPGEKVRSNPATGVRNVAAPVLVPRLRSGPPARPARRRSTVGPDGPDPSRHPRRPMRGCERIRRAPQRLAGDRIGAHPEEIEQVLLAHLRARSRPLGRRRGRPGRRPGTRRAACRMRRSSGSDSRQPAGAPHRRPRPTPSGSDSPTRASSCGLKARLHPHCSGRRSSHTPSSRSPTTIGPWSALDANRVAQIGCAGGEVGRTTPDGRQGWIG